MTTLPFYKMGIKVKNKHLPFSKSKSIKNLEGHQSYNEWCHSQAQKITPVIPPMDMPLRHCDTGSPGVSEEHPVEVCMTYQQELGRSSCFCTLL